MTGKLLWKFEAVEVVKAPPIVVGNYVVAGTLGGNLFVLDASDGQVLNQRKLDSPISVSPISDGDFIYIATESAKLVCLGDTNGTVQQKN
jgi:outer membrane protein assembly factor BamB